MIHENIAKFINQQKEQFNISGELSEDLINMYCETLGVNREQFMFILISLYINSVTQSDKVRAAYNEEYNRNLALNKTINDLKEKYKLGAYKVQASKIKNGVQYNKKQGSVRELRTLLEMGLSDAEIMERYKISKSTLWRWKKQLKEQ